MRKQTSLPQVDAPTIGKTASGMVFLVCVASFIIGEMTGFFAIFPPISILVAGMSATLYGLSWALGKQLRGK